MLVDRFGLADDDDRQRRPFALPQVDDQQVDVQRTARDRVHLDGLQQHRLRGLPSPSTTGRERRCGRCAGEAPRIRAHRLRWPANRGRRRRQRRARTPARRRLSETCLAAERSRGRADSCGRLIERADCTISGVTASILIVEDEYAVARGIQYALQQEGYEVTVARNGEEGLEIATQQRPGPGHPRRASSGHGRLRDAAPAARRRQQGAGAVPDRARRGDGQGHRPRARRRRLPDQAVRPARADEPHQGAAAPRVRRPGRCRRRTRRSATATWSSTSSGGASSAATGASA